MAAPEKNGNGRLSAENSTCDATCDCSRYPRLFQQDLMEVAELIKSIYIFTFGLVSDLNLYNNLEVQTMCNCNASTC